MADPRIPLKNPILAAVLAYLVPGAGHLYQGRLFKAAVYFFCILGTCLFGLYLSDWKAVYHRWDARHRNIAFFAQAGVGVLAIPAYIQNRRFKTQAAENTEVELPISSEFHGRLIRSQNDVTTIEGRIELYTEPGDFGIENRGKFSGHSIAKDGSTKPVELDLASQMQIDPRIGPGAGRGVVADVVDVENGNTVRVGWIAGEMPRSFVNHFAAPLQDEDMEALNRDLGKYFELAKIFTWIAGLLNVLAVWDAFEGPAYGYGDEEESTDEKKDDPAGEATASATESKAAVEEKPTADTPAAAEEPVA